MEQRPRVYGLRGDNQLRDAQSYMVADGIAFGPLPDDLFPGGDVWPESVPLKEIEAGGARWLEPPELFRITWAWYTLQSTAAGECFVLRTAGYRVALRAFLASDAAEMLTVHRVKRPWAFPFVRLYPNGRWAVGDDAMTEPLVLPIWGEWGADPATRLESETEEGLGGRESWRLVGRSSGDIEYAEPAQDTETAGQTGAESNLVGLEARVASYALPWFDHAAPSSGAIPSLEADSMYSMAHDSNLHTYLIGGTHALGPLPEPLYTIDPLLSRLGESGFLRQVIPLHELKEHGLRWQPRPGNLRYPFAWYVVRQTPVGIAFVRRYEGYYEAFRSFLASDTARAMFKVEKLIKPWAFPFVRLYPNGAWETGDDTLTEPVVLPGRARARGQQIEAEFEEDLEDALNVMQPYGMGT